MKKVHEMRWLRVSGLLVIGLICALLQPARLAAAVEETFDVLQIGTRTYRNVTVTTKSKNYIFIMHSTGMNNLKVSELPPEVRAKLGYSETAAADGKKSPGSLANWTKHTVSGMHLRQLEQLPKNWHAMVPPSLANITWTKSLERAAILSAVLLYILLCYCSMLICYKTNHPPGILVWIPVLQLVPLLRAAGMSPGWIVAFLLPVVNVIAQIVWSFSISKARGKSAWVGFFLIVPVTSLLAYLYLALSDQPAAKKERRVVEIMTLDAA